MTYDEPDLRRSLVETCRATQRKGLVKGTSGNVSARIENGFLISPTGIPYENLQPEQIVRMRWDGTIEGCMTPSSEWRFHRDILKQRSDLNAIVHTHSMHATAVSILGREIPPIHYRIAAVGGPTIRCAGYATFGTQALADLAVVALEGRRACLLAHHGVIAAHSSLNGALNIAELVEELATLYLLCLPMGTPPQLSAEAITEVIERHKTYGQQPRSDKGVAASH